MDAPNSVTILSDFLRVSKKIIDAEKTGIYNLVNEGVVQNSEIIKMYEKISGTEHIYEIISSRELDKITVAKRSNCILSTSKLSSEGFQMPHIRLSLEKLITEYVNFGS